MKNGGDSTLGGKNSRCKGPDLGVCDLDKVQQGRGPCGWSMREKGLQKGQALPPTVLLRAQLPGMPGPCPGAHVAAQCLTLLLSATPCQAGQGGA